MIQAPLRYQKLWLILGWLLVGSVWYLSLTPRPPQIDLGIEFFDKISHFIAYATMMGWFMQLYVSHRVRIYYALGFICMGVAIEILQGMGKTRMFEYADMLANTAGVFCAFLIISKLFDRVLYRFEKIIIK